MMDRAKPDVAAHRKPALVSWSGGKDSALALHELRGRGTEVAALVTTVTAGFDRISMHGVRRELLTRQALSLGVALEEVMIPKAASNDVYEERFAEVLVRHRGAGVETVVFGDLFLEDIRSYRDAFLGRLGMRGDYPLWRRDTGELARRFVSLGFRAILVCVDPRTLDPSFAGRWFDEELLESLPDGVDPCGENGEFHTFVVDGPGFREPVAVRPGAVVRRDPFVYCELAP